MFDFSVITNGFVKLIDWFFKPYDPFTELDKQHRCRIFALDTYQGHYGCAIEYPEESKEIIIWTLFPESHPNIYYSKDFISF